MVLCCPKFTQHRPSPNGLMRRNRLITALSRAVIVVEAGPSSGALYAARGGHDQGRPVFAINNSAGNAELLKEFAHLLPMMLTSLIDKYLSSSNDD